MLQKITLIILLTLSYSSFAYLPNEGDIAPDFEITSINGKPFKLSDYKGKKSVYVIFWNTWCHYCMKKIPKLKAVQKSLSKDIKVIAINTSRDDSVEESLSFQKRFDINYMLAFDDNEIITDLYNVHGVPTEFIIDINGIIQYRDDVPENIKKHVDGWNTVSHNQTENYFTNLASIVFTQIPKSIFSNINFNELIDVFAETKIS